ncbi:MAG: ribosome maturation factor RimM [Muribaculaceae bacterium]|nr:ribosome maturation factor RimM [Muribaculaceae bacterium]MDE6321216.1 ribosome maturation factor RimM [Muribaculaceae bacterium]
MITRQQLTEVGRTIKPHGINGEIAAAIDPILDLDTARCLVLDIDGIFVPFFVGSWRSRGSEAVLLNIDGVSDENAAKSLCGKAVYALNEDVHHDGDDDDGFYADDLQGYTIVDDNASVIGTVVRVDTSTVNTLFEVERPDGSTVYVPVADEFILGINPQDGIIEMSLPEGLFDL